MNATATKRKDSKIVELLLELLDDCLTNPRRVYLGIEELAESIRARGVLQPLVVRRKGDRYEIVCGHRRVRGARLAGLTAVPVVVREYESEAEVLEDQVAENCARADIHPLEECDAFCALEDQGRSAEHIAARVAKPVQHVRKRLQLRHLVAKCRTALYGERITLGVAYLLSRVPDEKLQAEALEAVLAPKGHEPIGVRDASDIIQSRFMLRLSEAPFDRNDANLVPAAGSCKDCPKRTGCQPELFEDVRAKDSCIDPACFAAKVDANWKKAVGRAEKQGLAVLPPKEVRKLYHGRTERISHGAAYVDPGSVNYRDPERRTWKTLLGKHAPPLVLAQNPLGAPVRLLPRAAAEAKLAELGVSFERPDPPAEIDRTAPVAVTAHARDVAGRAAKTVLTRIANRLREEGIYPEVWAILMRLTLDGSIDCAREPDSEERRARIDEALGEPDVRELQAFLIEDLLGVTLHLAYHHGERPDELVSLAALYQIDYDAIEADLAEAPATAA